MNVTLHEVLARRADDVNSVQLDVDELTGLGEQRLRRRRVAVTVFAAAGVVAFVVVGVLISATFPKATGPIDHPARPDQTQGPVTRKVVYSDSQLFTHTRGSIHFGEREVETGDGFVHLDTTDDGFIYTSDGRAWFSDGGPPVQIGTHVCGASPNGEFSNFANRSVMTANTGSRAAWFDCTETARPSLVVYDTAARIEVVHRPIPSCRRWCELVDVTADFVYFNRGVYAGFPKPEYRFDVTTHQLRGSSRHLYAEDLTSHPRGLVVGDTWRKGTPTNGIGQVFSVRGSRLVPLWLQRQGGLTDAFDTATGHVVRLRLPPGYHGDPNEDFVLFEWLDDHTVALASGGGGNGLGDIVTCRLSEGSCNLAVKRAQGAQGQEAPRRLLPYLPLPG